MHNFNKNLDKVTEKELADDLLGKIDNAGQAAISRLNDHTNDKIAHISPEERTNWNSKAPNRSPKFTGEPTAPTPPQSTNNDQLATTRFINEKLINFEPTVANAAKKLVSTNSFSIRGAIESSAVSFDGTNNVVLSVNTIKAENITGHIDPTVLDGGTYNINILGTAAKANDADSISGYHIRDLAKIESPNFTGKPMVPTAAAGDESTQIANTNFVTNAIRNIQFPEGVKTAEKLATPINVKISGKASSQTVTFDGSSDLNLNVTSIDIQDQLDTYMPKKVNNHSVEADVPPNAKFTDTIYTHPNTVTDLTNSSYTQVVVDRQGHVVHGSNPKSMDIDITGNSATAVKLKDRFKIKLSGHAIIGGESITMTDGLNDANLVLDQIRAEAILTDKDHRLVTDEEKDSYADKYTKAEIDDRFKTFRESSGFNVVGSVDTENDIATSFPSPSEGSVVFVKDTGLLYRFNGSSWKNMAEYSNVTRSKHGLMTSVDKIKLDGIEEGANKYVLPSTLPASMITPDDSKQFLTAEEKEKLANIYTKEELDSKFTTAANLASNSKAGLMTPEDKAKLDGIAANANKYELPKTLPASMIDDDETHRFLTDVEKASLADKYTKQEVDKRISDATPLVTQSQNGLMRSTDKVKLDGIEANANFYELPSTLPASMIVPDENKQFISKVEKESFNDKFTKSETRDLISKATQKTNATTSTAGLMSPEDKAKLDGIDVNANKYELPTTLPASIISEDTDHRFVTDQEKDDFKDKYTKTETEGLIEKAKPDIATTASAGLMSASDKAKLDNIAENANKYELPKTLPASMITDDSTHRFVTDLEKVTFNDKYTKSEIDGLLLKAKPIEATTESAGLLSAADKAKLDGIAANANKYELPSTLPATMITTDDDHQFISKADKALYSDKYTKAETQNLITTSIMNANTDGMIWKKEVNSFSDLSTTYPDPKKGWTVSVNDTGEVYRYNGKEWATLAGSGNKYKLVTQSTDGLMAATDKTKLDGIEAGANNYKLPETLPAAMIQTTDDRQFISSVEKETYADKYTKAEINNLIKTGKPSLATSSEAGLMSKEDKAKLDGIAANANKYELPNKISARIIETFDDMQFISKTEKELLGDKYTKQETLNLIKDNKPSNASTSAAGLMTADDKAKLDSIAFGANKFELPNSIEASKIKEDAQHKFITEDEKNKLADVYTKSEITNLISEHTVPAASGSIAGLMSPEDKAKLDSIETGANKYTLPDTLPASMITEDNNHKFVTNVEKDNYADKYTRSEIDNKFKDFSDGKLNIQGLMKFAGKLESSNISKSWEENKTFIDDSGNLNIFTARTDESSTPSRVLSYTNTATTTSVGLMSKEDKAKLDAIEVGANKYVLPSTLSAEMITPTNDKLFMSKEDKAKLDGIGNASTNSAGLMSKEDKAKLDGIAANANKYELPSTLPASMITEDNNRKFISSAEKTKLVDMYNKAQLDNIIRDVTKSKATTLADGLMSKEDKAKLDGIAANANKYELPDTLPASMITEDDSRQFLTKAEKAKIGTGYTKAESDAKYLTKLEAKTDKITVGTGWVIEPNNSGNLEIKFNNLVKATIGSDGKFVAPTISEGTYNTTGSSSKTINELLTEKANVSAVNSLRDQLTDKINKKQNNETIVLDITPTSSGDDIKLAKASEVLSEYGDNSGIIFGAISVSSGNIFNNICDSSGNILLE